MPEISLVVTQRALNHITGGRQSESQIAIRSPLPDIAPMLQQLTTRNRVNLTLGGYLTLVAGDPGAVWRAHNTQHAEDFDSLFELLSRRPGREMRLLCEIV